MTASVSSAVIGLFRFSASSYSVLEHYIFSRNVSISPGFSNFIPSLHPCDEFYLIMVSDLFNLLLDAVCQYFVENFSICVHQ